MYLFVIFAVTPFKVQCLFVLFVLDALHFLADIALHFLADIVSFSKIFSHALFLSPMPSQILLLSNHICAICEICKTISCRGSARFSYFCFHSLFNNNHVLCFNNIALNERSVQSSLFHIISYLYIGEFLNYRYLCNEFRDIIHSK